jgi:hypothetical protein
MATEADKVNDGALATLVAVGTLSMIGICAFVTALVRHEMSNETERKELGAGQEVQKVKEAQRAKLNAPPAWADRGKGLVSMPIERAKELVLTDLARDPNTATPPPPRPEDAGVTPAAIVPDAGAENADAGADTASDAGGGVQGSAVSEPAPGGPERPAEKKVAAAPTPAPAPAPAKPAPAPAPAAPAAPASVASP